MLKNATASEADVWSAERESDLRVKGTNQMQQRMGSGMAWAFGLGAAVLGSLTGFLVVSVGTLGTLGAFGLMFAVFAAVAVSKTSMSRGGVIGVFIACALVGCIGFYMTTSNVLASELAAEVAKSPDMAEVGQATADAAAGVAGGFAGALLSVGAFVAALVFSIVGSLVGKKA